MIAFRVSKLTDLVVDVSLTNVARGDVLYRGASKWNNLAAGTAGYVLTSGGAGADPSWTAVTVPTAANPSGSVGLSAVNGVATTFMRSDAAPALDMSIAPTWTGQHVFQAATSSTAAIFKGAVTTPANVTEWRTGANSLFAAMQSNRSLMLDDSYGGAVIQDSGGNNIFRGIRAGGWDDSATTTYFQIGANSGNTILASASGTTFGRFLINSVTTQLSRGNTAVPSGSNVVEVLTNNGTKTLLAVRGISGQTAPLMQLQGISSTSTVREMANIDATWADSTDASRKARLVLSAYDTAARECIRAEASGTAPMLGFYGVAATARQVLATGAGATVDNVITALQTLGLVSQS